MIKSKLIMVCLGCLGCLWAGPASMAESLLSNNLKSGNHSKAFPKGTDIIETTFKSSWVTNGDFQSDAESIKTPSAKLFDGNTGSNWKSRTYSKWAGGKWATLNVDLGRVYAVSKVSVWALHEETRDTDSFEVLFSKRGKQFVAQGLASMPDVAYGKNNFVPITLRFEKPILGRYLQIRIKRKPSAKQQQVGEIAIWGSKPKAGVSYIDAGARPAVVFSVQTVQAGVARLVWTDAARLAKGVKSWRVYRSELPFNSARTEGVVMVKEVPGKDTQATIYPLRPGNTYYFAITGVYADGEQDNIQPQSCVMPLPMASKCFGDMVAINHFWGGGGNREKQVRDHTAYETVALDLLADTGIRHIRWWVVNKDIYEKYYEKGIGVFSYPHSNNLKKGAELGVWSFAGAQNEPDLSTRPIPDYIAALKKVGTKRDRDAPHALICAPSSGLEDHSIEWLDSFLGQGGKGSFDVLDLHTYTKIAGGHAVPAGYPRGAPEAMIDNMKKMNAVLAKHGIADIPVISTEFGYSEAIPNNPSGRITPQTKADFLVRGLVLHHVLGFKRVFLYSFFDEGTDHNYTEHTFGLIDFHLQKKPGYFAVKTLMDVLGKSNYVAPIAGIALPTIGYRYRDESKKNNTFILWDGVKDKVVTLRTDALQVQWVDLMGKSRTVLPEEDGTFTVRVGASPSYVVSTGDIRVVSVGDAPPLATGGRPHIELGAKEIVIQHDATSAALSFKSSNPTSQPMKARVVVSNPRTPGGKRILDTTITLPPGNKTVSGISIPVTPNVLQELSVQVIPRLGHSGTEAQVFKVFIRQLYNAGAETQIHQAVMPGLDNPVYVLSNDKLEISIDVSRGARVLEMIERSSGSNQLNMNYALLGSLPSIPFAYGLWTTLNGRMKNDGMTVVNSQGSKLVLKGRHEFLELTQTWTLAADTLTLSSVITNHGKDKKAVKYYIHPEYTVGGKGESVTDVLYLPSDKGITTLPFWSGLGDKPWRATTPSWWAAVDTKASMVLHQSMTGEYWATPRIWFGQGCYNLELMTKRGFSLEAGATWKSTLTWSVKQDSLESIEAMLNKGMNE